MVTWLRTVLIVLCGHYVTLVAGDVIGIESTHVAIELSSENDSISNSLIWRVYKEYDRYANVPSSGIKGVIHQPVPRNACSPVQPLPEDTSITFALVDDYSSCNVDMIANIENAGYKLIIASSHKDTARTVTKNSGFPVVLVTEAYATYLKNNVTVENITDIDYSSVIEANVNLYTSFTGLYTLIGAFCCCGSIICCILFLQWSCKQRGRRNRGPQPRQHSLTSRTELTESIRRHLADLHVDPRSQVPLGEKAAKRLPTRKYRADREQNETCVICVDDFTDGDNLRVLPCNHVFHSKCVDEWLINHSSLCPLCKTEVPRHKEQGNRYVRIHDVTSDDDSGTIDSSRQPLTRNNSYQYGAV